MRVIFSGQSKRDLRDIADWISEDSIPAAKRTVANLRKLCADLGLFPNRFTRLDAQSQFRRRVVAPYVILYTVGDEVTIVRILHGARDYAALFSGAGES